MYFVRLQISLICFCYLISNYVVVNDVVPDHCEQTGSCTCQINAFSINLTDLALKDQPKFNITINSTESSTTTSILYNPCNNFNIKEAENVTGSCNQKGGVAVCLQVTSHVKNTSEYSSFGTQRSAVFHYVNPHYQISYTDNNQGVYISLICTNSTDSSLKFVNYNDSSQSYYLDLISPCACDGGCSASTTTPTTSTSTTPATPTPSPAKGLSAGSILVICFFVLAGAYLLGGMFYRKFVLGAQGLEIIPNYEFWMDFPFLVKDGFLYLFTCCKPQTTYDNI